MTIWRKITRHCEIFVRKSKQSISVAYESYMNRLLCVNLWLGLLIRFWVIYFLYLLKSRVLDCHENPADFLAMTNLCAMTTLFNSLTLPTKESK